MKDYNLSLKLPSQISYTFSSSSVEDFLFMGIPDESGFSFLSVVCDLATDTRQEHRCPAYLHKSSFTKVAYFINIVPLDAVFKAQDDDRLHNSGICMV